MKWNCVILTAPYRTKHLISQSQAFRMDDTAKEIFLKVKLNIRREQNCGAVGPVGVFRQV